MGLSGVGGGYIYMVSILRQKKGGILYGVLRYVASYKYILILLFVFSYHSLHLGISPIPGWCSREHVPLLLCRYHQTKWANSKLVTQDKVHHFHM